jgi:Ca2+-binding RTX toxin-like protein
MRGGEGNDSYSVNSIDDVASEAGRNGIDTIVANFNFALNFADVENLTLLGTALRDTVESSAYSFSLDASDIENITMTGSALYGYGNDLANIIIGTAGINFIASGGGSDKLYGGGGDDYLNAGLGNDILRGGAGSDDLNGGSGRDTFDYDLLIDAGDIIWDFAKGATGDILDLRDLMDGIGYVGADAFGDGYLSFTQSNGGTNVFVDPDGFNAGAATLLVRIGSITLLTTDTKQLSSMICDAARCI